ncbi:hypothetical protein SpCBS45565_g07153 [Spizellomyces sp. 'palustris']|nr:hypothetical protein SpCBS45565_g07153 [Spizellomyces sp. 'palustris']
MAPLTRNRAIDENIPNELMAKYYEQRSNEGGLIITEGTAISKYAHGYANVPGIYTDEMEDGWRNIVKRVHAKKGIFFMQLWHVGRQSHPAFMPNNELPHSASAVQPNVDVYLPTGKMEKAPTPHAMTIDEIRRTLSDYKEAARRARRAGFDGVELHGANGYLIDQFLQDGTNKRTDAYGGSIENRARFAIEAIEAAIEGAGGEAGRVGIRFAPWGAFGDMSESNTEALFSYVLEKLNKYNLAYVHLVEPRIGGNQDEPNVSHARQLQPLRDIYRGNLMVAGGYLKENADEAIQSGYADLVAFGRWYLANPDFVERLRKDLPLNKYHRPTFYSNGAEGYVDYPFYEEVKQVGVQSS